MPSADPTRRLHDLIKGGESLDGGVRVGYDAV